ncbi:MAG TPA: tetratricopeptide repeat protein [Symbiobacteriaceae bacterium]|nr:tetratricopeptide repeat protein [Symbiobacteriaceae bacterium]
MRLQRGVAVLLLLGVWLALLLPARALAEPTTGDPKRDSQSKFAVGQMYERAGDLTQAEQYYREALELWPDNEDARKALQGILDARKPVEQPQPFWVRWFSWLPGVAEGGSTYTASIMEIIGWIAAIVLFVALFFKFGTETIRLAILRSKGIPLLGLGEFNDPTGRLPGLPHQLATNMNDAGLTFYDEKGAILPDFNFIGDSGFAQARLLAKALEMLYSRAVQRINVDTSLDDGMLNASVSLVDSGNGYVRYLHVVSVDPQVYGGAGELTRVVAQLVADAILISISRDPNTRGLLYQRMGDWTNALKEFTSAAETAKKRGLCGTYYQAHLNLGNLYSFLGLQDKSVAAYNEVAEKASSALTLALIQAAMACSYRNWCNVSPPDQRGTYEWLARQAIEKALAAPQKSPLIAYTIACYYSLSNQIDECLRWLREAVSGDLAYLDYVLSDPDMENLMKWLNGRSPAEALGLRV